MDTRSSGNRAEPMYFPHPDYNGDEWGVLTWEDANAAPTCREDWATPEMVEAALAQYRSRLTITHATIPVTTKAGTA
jgi:hypothetical protein